MTKKFYLLPALLIALTFAACNETAEVGEYDNWRERNEAFIDSLQRVYDAKTDPALKKVVYPRDKSINIFYKELERSPNSPTPTATERPKYTSTVKMAYRGMLINEKVFDTNMSGANFDPDTDTPATFAVNQLIGGWTELLQVMIPGQRFEAYIPYQAAYGTSGSGTIPGYSTLIFDMELLDVTVY